LGAVGEFYYDLYNILLTDLRDPIAQYTLNTGEGTVTKDSVGHYDGSITNVEWQIHI